MFDYKLVLGVSASLIALVAYIPYFRNMLAGRTKPHAFSWLVWAIITGVVFLAQVLEGAGIGSLALGVTTGICIGIFVWALVKGERSYTILDWVSLAGAFVCIALWLVLKDPTLSVVLAVVIDSLAFIPTITKAYRKPFEETILTFFLSGTKFLFVVISLEMVNVATALYPAYLVLMNYVFVGMVIIRRKRFIRPR